MFDYKRNNMAQINLIEQVLKDCLLEVGDLDNIESFESRSFQPNQKYFHTSFDTEYGLVEIELQMLDEQNLKKYFETWDVKSKIYNLNYTVGNSDKQFKKTDYKFLIKVLKTICDKTIKFIQQFKPDGILILGNTRGNKNSDIKSRIYREILEKNLNKIDGYEIGLHGFKNKQGFLISR